jgi:hypothetical protein
MRNWIATALVVMSALLALAAPALAENEEPAQAKVEQKEEAKPKARADFGMCMGIATRCGLLPKGACFMQSGCYNPAFGDRCGGTARYCTHFMTKGSCHMQQGCTWVKSTSQSQRAEAPAAKES